MVAPLVLVGTTAVGGVQSVTSVALPTGTRAGDLIVVSAACYEMTFGMADSRLTRHVNIAAGSFAGSIWTGYEDGSGNPVGLTMSTTRPSTFLSRAVVSAYRSKILGDIETVVGVADPTIPSVPYRGAIAAQFSGYGEVHGQAVMPSGWVYGGGGGTGRVDATVISWTGDAPSPSPTWNHTGSVVGDFCGMIVFGARPKVVAAPPARLFPREDGLGVGGGRHFPPAKSQQRSGRRFGYY